MSRFIEEAIAKGGMSGVLAAKRAGDLDTVRSTVTSWGTSDLLVLGAVADLVRAEDVGEVVRIHEHATGDLDVTWVDASVHASELEFLRAVAVARIAARKGARVGVDWSKCGLELAQVALGFGACDMRGPITRKSGLPIYADEKLKVKGQGMVELASIKRQEIGALVAHAGRVAVFVDNEEEAARTREPSQEVAGV